MATTNISINFLTSADSGDVVCTTRIDRRGRRAAFLIVASCATRVGSRAGDRDRHLRDHLALTWPPVRLGQDGLCRGISSGHCCLCVNWTVFLLRPRAGPTPRWLPSSDGCFTPIPPPRGSSGTRTPGLAVRELRFPLAQERLRALTRVRARSHVQEQRPLEVQPLVEAEPPAPAAPPPWPPAPPAPAARRGEPPAPAPPRAPRPPRRPRSPARAPSARSALTQPAQQQHLHRRRPPHAPRQPLRAAGARDQPEPDLRRPEPHARISDEEIARQRELQPAAQRVAAPARRPPAGAATATRRTPAASARRARPSPAYRAPAPARAGPRRP